MLSVDSSFLAPCSPCLIRQSALFPSHSLCALPVSLTLRSPCLTPHSILTVSHSSLYAHRVSLLKLCSPCLTPHTVLNLKLPASCSMVFFLPSTPPTAESLAVAFCQTCSPAPTGGSSVCHRVPQPRLGQRGHAVCHHVPQPLLVAMQCVTVCNTSSASSVISTPSR